MFFAFGNLVDAMITEPNRIDWWRKLLDGQPAKDFDKAKKMYESVMSDSRIVSILKNSKMQHVASDVESSLTWVLTLSLIVGVNGISLDTSGDIKTTAATNQKQFGGPACLHFDYP